MENMESNFKVPEEKENRMDKYELVRLHMLPGGGLIVDEVFSESQDVDALLKEMEHFEQKGEKDLSIVLVVPRGKYTSLRGKWRYDRVIKGRYEGEGGNL